MTWPKIPTYQVGPTYISLIREHSKGASLETFEAFDQSNEETWLDQKIPTYLPT